jgi:hypothetical protein
MDRRYCAVRTASSSFTWGIVQAVRRRPARMMQHADSLLVTSAATIWRQSFAAEMSTMMSTVRSARLSYPGAVTPTMVVGTPLSEMLRPRIDGSALNVRFQTRSETIARAPSAALPLNPPPICRGMRTTSGNLSVTKSPAEWMRGAPGSFTMLKY